MHKYGVSERVSDLRASFGVETPLRHCRAKPGIVQSGEEAALHAGASEFFGVIPRGQLVECSGPFASSGGNLSLVMQSLKACQSEGESAVWIQLGDSPSFHPPDAEVNGIDLEAMVFVSLPPNVGSAGMFKAAEWLLLSGGVGMVVLDLGAVRTPPNCAWQGRLLNLARERNAALVCLTEKSSTQESLGPLVSLRLQASMRWLGRDRIQTELEVLKNKMGQVLPALPKLSPLLGAEALGGNHVAYCPQGLGAEPESIQANHGESGPQEPWDAFMLQVR